MNRKVLHVLSTPRAEGTPNLVLDWMTVNGQMNEIFVLNSTPPHLTQELRSRADWYEESQLFTQPRIWKFARMVWTVCRICRARRPNLVICWPTGFANWVCLAARLALGSRVRLLVHCGNPPNRGIIADWISRFVFWAVWLCRGRCVCCSHYVSGEYQSIPAVPNGLFCTVYNCTHAKAAGTPKAEQTDTRHMHQQMAGRWPVAIMVGTMERHKDHASLLRCVPMVIKQLPQFALILVGDGTLRQQLEALTAELGIESSIYFIGATSNVMEWLGRADLFVFSTTEQEGLGLAVLEGLAAGLPVIATDVPACRELLQGGKWGRLVLPHDPGSLAQAIIEAAKSPRLSDVSGLDRYLEQFTPEAMVKQYMHTAFPESVQPLTTQL